MLLEIPSAAGRHDAQYGFAVQILQWKAGSVGCRIERHHVRIRAEAALADPVQRPTLQRERRHDAVFARHVQTLQPGIEGQ